jgi:DNA polymerase-3 subunit alpha
MSTEQNSEETSPDDNPEESESITESVPPSSFVHLHCHSEYSALDGGSKVENMPAKLKELGMQSMALTDHGVMQGLPHFYDTLKDEGIKPILGLEAYLTEDRFAPPSKSQTWHITLLAENNTGYTNLCKISTWAFIEGLTKIFGRPRARADWELLQKYNQGIICLTGCMAGPVMNEIMSKGNLTQAKYNIQRLIDIFGKEQVYGEIQNVGIVVGIPGDSEAAKYLNKSPLTAEEAANFQPEKGEFADKMQEGEVPISQTEANRILVEMCKEMDLKYCGTGDVHYLEIDDAIPHDAMICIGSGQVQKGKRSFQLLPKHYHLRSEDEMKQSLKEWPESLTETLSIAERCNVEIQYDQELLPSFPIPDNFSTSKDYLKHLCQEGLEERYPENHQLREDAFKRLEYELGVIDKMGYNDYFLIVWDFVNYANQQKIPTGPGRGSAAGSIVAYCLDITKLDPLEHGLLFERFLNPDRVSMPDIDQDISQLRREELIEYVREKYNTLANAETAVAQIVTFSKFRAKGALKDAARILAEPDPEGKAAALKLGDKLAGYIPNNPQSTMKRVWNDEKGLDGRELRSAFKRGGAEAAAIKQAGWMEGLIKAYSTHAAAVVIASHDLTNEVPLQKVDKDKGLEIQYDMHYAEKIGLLKMDFLGLRNLDIIDETVEKIKHVRGLKLDPYKDIPMDDKETYEMLAHGKAIGIFQFESPGMRSTLQEIQPTEFNDLIAIVALYRPGSMGHILTYAVRKRGDEKVSYIDPRLEQFLAETYGVVCIEENQKISMADGSLKPIKEIRRGEMVSSFDLEDNNKAVIEEVHGVRPTRFEKGLNILLGDGSKLTLTKDHKVLTCRGYVEAQHLDPEKDLVATPSYLRTNQNPRSLNQEWLGADKNLAYLLGQMTGDGSLTSNNITISTGTPENHRKLAEFIKRNLKLVTNEYFHCRSWYIGLSNPELLNDKNYGNRKTRFHKMLEDFGMKQTCYEKTVPTPILRASSEVKASYLAGLFDADGNITKRGSLILTSVSDELLDGVKALLLSLGLTSKKKKDRLYISNSKQAKELLSDHTLRINWEKVSSGQKDRTRLLLRADFKKTVESLNIPGRQFAKECGVSRKTAQIKEKPFILEGISNKVSPHTGDLCYKPIQSISETSEKKQFYGISVNRTHNFVCNFAVVKNCYQEQSMLIARELGGFTPGQADDLRKAIGKKLHDKMAALKDPYIKGCLENGISKTDAETLWADNEAAADYSFNKSHAACYAYVSYITAYLKRHYPEEYMASLLSSVIGKKQDDKPRMYLTEAKEMKLNVLQPDINRSLRDFSVMENEEDSSVHDVLFGLTAIGGVGDKVVESIIQERKKRGNFTSLYNLIRRMPSLNKAVIISLARGGAMDNLPGSRKAIEENAEKAVQRNKKQIKAKEKAFANSIKEYLIDNPRSSDEVNPGGKNKGKRKLTNIEKRAIEGGCLKAMNLDEQATYDDIYQETEAAVLKEALRAAKADIRTALKENPREVVIAGVADEDNTTDEKTLIEQEGAAIVEKQNKELVDFSEDITKQIVHALQEVSKQQAAQQGFAIAMTEEADPTLSEEEWDEITRLNYERSKLGTYVTGHPLEADKVAWAHYVSKGLGNIDDQLIGERIRVVGALVDKKPIPTRKGDVMYKVVLEDLTGSREVTIFPATVEGGIEEMLEVGQVVAFEARVEEDRFARNKKEEVQNEEEGDEQQAVLADSAEEEAIPVQLIASRVYRWNPDRVKIPEQNNKNKSFKNDTSSQSDKSNEYIDLEIDELTADKIQLVKEISQKYPGETSVRLLLPGKKPALTQLKVEATKELLTSFAKLK